MTQLALALAAAFVWTIASAAGPHDEVRSDRSDEPLGLIPKAGTDLYLLGTKDTDGFVSEHARAGLLWSLDSVERFSGIHVGADEYRQHGWSMHGASLLAAYRDVERATGAGLTVLGGVSRAGDAVRAVGEFAWNRRIGESTGVELVGERAFVETRAGLESATMSNFLAASVDHTIADRLTLFGLAGAQAYSDDNRRLHLRGRAIYLVSPEWGFGLEARIRAFESSQTGGTTYFNPEHYARGELGLRLRRSFEHWRVLAEAGAGSEALDGNVRKGTYYAGLRAQRTFENDVALAFQYASQRSSESDAAVGAGGNYRWQYLRALLLVPF